MVEGLSLRLTPIECSAGRQYAATRAVMAGEAEPHTRTHDCSNDAERSRGGDAGQNDDDDDDDDEGTTVISFARSASGENADSVCRATAARAEREAPSKSSSALLLLLLLLMGGCSTAFAICEARSDVIMPAVA